MTIVGTGYVGLVTAVCMAEKGHNVICMDIDENKIQRLSSGGDSGMYERDLNQLMQKNKERLTFTTDYELAFKEVEVIFVGVGTPQKMDGAANLTYLYDVAEQIATNAKTKCIVIIKSTVPIGTNDKLEKYLNDNKKNDIKIDIVSNPEFLSQGTAVQDTLHPSRIVIGCENEESKKVMEKVYAKFDAPKIFTNRRSAEMIKYASNNFLALKISYINEIANLCEKIGANIDDVTKGMSFDERIGSKFLNAGIGYGGSCFPKDTKALNWISSFNDYELKTVKAAIDVNENQKLKLLKKAKKYYENFQGLTVAILGLTFKPGTDDLREAPSLTNIAILLEDGAIIKAYDPIGQNNFKKIYPSSITYCDSIEDTLENADICFIFTEWPEIKAIDPKVFNKLMRHAIILDGRNCFDINKMKTAGIVYDSIGRPLIDVK